VSKKLNKILNERQEQYGSARDNFTRIGIGWGAIIGTTPIPAHIVALMYDFGKTIRCSVNPEQEDSWFDKQGYTILGQEIVGKNES
jgi:hypothetical protein